MREKEEREGEDREEEAGNKYLIENRFHLFPGKRKMLWNINRHRKRENEGEIERKKKE